MELSPELKRELAKEKERAEKLWADEGRRIKEQLHRVREENRVLRANIEELDRAKARVEFARQYLLPRQPGSPRPVVIEWKEELFPSAPTHSPELELEYRLAEFIFVPLSLSVMADACRAVYQACQQLYPAAEIECFPEFRAVRLVHPIAQEFPSKYAGFTEASSTVMVRLFLRGGSLLVKMEPDAPLSMLEGIDDEAISDSFEVSIQRAISESDSILKRLRG